MLPLVTTDTTSLVYRLPSVPDVERRCVALAMLDAILSPKWEYRYYSFNRYWDRARNQRMGSFRDGCGDEYFILFSSDTVASIKGFGHEAFDGRSVKGVLDGIPDAFVDFKNEPAFDMENITFCLWNVGGGWQRSGTLADGVIERDGSASMLGLLVGTPADYAEYARDNFEIAVLCRVVARFFALDKLTAALAASLRHDVDLAQIEDIDEIGYPRSPCP
jgi:hypothetical protein